MELSKWLTPLFERVRRRSGHCSQQRFCMTCTHADVPGPNALQCCDQVSPSSPGHAGLPPAHRRVMAEAEPADSGHSGHTPKAERGAQQPEQAPADSARARHAFQFAQAGGPC